MKKFIALFVLSIVFLSGCSMPFGSSSSASTLQFINGNAETLTASEKIDGVLIKKLDSAKTKKTKFDELLIEARKTRDTQQDLYDSVQQDETVLNDESVRAIFLNMIDSRIASYDVIIETLGHRNYDALASVVEEHKIKDENESKKELAKLNTVLTDLKEKKRKTWEK